MPTPKITMRIQPIATFQINTECKISAFAIMMPAKKEDSTTSMIIKM